ncbi:hypothetical protein [Trinickia soli]|uniref:Uncharacterized protein n=1 Tax=Trinickia soli TaxID=380675 RepID=A0A2N7WFJ5_9BURK|nr:hypothetical protein [Trinickia soli]KAA0089760.1 hypothetical protein CIW54_07095 [Paraburkholderia sp. T12-10]PMS28226.1 hypothetical protein C0Z19_00355 [Trinickia soli]CAB3663128.1 hypothetical protein LMG24076_01553 [Trinickia soli]
MTIDTVQIISGGVISASQKPIVIDVWSPNLGPTTDQDEQITVRLDSIDRPLILKTGTTRELFIGTGDRLDVAYIELPDRLAILGIRNVKDGSVYLVRTADVVSARREIYTTLSAQIVCAIVAGLMGFVKRSIHVVVEPLLLGVAVCAGLGAVSAIVRTVSGRSVWPDVRKLVQPGGKREMDAARKALVLEPDEVRAIRFL